MSTPAEIEKAREHASIRDLRAFVGELVREAESLRAQLTQAREALEAWAAMRLENGVDESGSSGPWSRAYMNAERLLDAAHRALASHPSSPEGEKP